MYDYAWAVTGRCAVCLRVGNAVLMRWLAMAGIASYPRFGSGSLIQAGERAFAQCAGVVQFVPGCGKRQHGISTERRAVLPVNEFQFAGSGNGLMAVGGFKLAVDRSHLRLDGVRR